MSKNIFAARLRELRGSSSQREMYTKIGISQPTYSCWESGTKFPLAFQLSKISITLGISADWLLGLSDRREGGVKTVADPALVAENESLKAENARLKAELLRHQGEIAGLNSAIKHLSNK